MYNVMDNIHYELWITLSLSGLQKIKMYLSIFNNDTTCLTRQDRRLNEFTPSRNHWSIPPFSPLSPPSTLFCLYSEKLGSGSFHRKVVEVKYSIVQ